MGNYIFSEFELAVRRIADTEDGKFVLDHLYKHKVDRACLPSTVGDGVGTAMVMSFRDGEANVIRELIKITKRDETK